MMLETKDLVLRTVDRGDLEEVARMWDFEKGSISLEEAEQVIDFMKANHERNQRGRIYHLCLAVFEKDKNHIIGWCGLDGRNRRKLDIFYSIDPACRNRGYATQCARRMLRYAFEEAKAPFVNGGCYKENIASYRVMKKAGMEQDGFEENGDPLFLIDKTRYCELRQTDEYFLKGDSYGKTFWN